MPLCELEKTQEYSRLTLKQKLFVATYIQRGLQDGIYDAIKAIRTSYECKNDEIARVMSYRLMANIHIIEVLNRHFGASPIDEFIQQIDLAVRSRRTTLAQVQALKVKCEALKLANALPVYLDGQTNKIVLPVRLRAVNPNGVEKQEVKKKKPGRPRKTKVENLPPETNPYAID